MPDPIIINDSNYREHVVPPNERGKGYMGMWKPGHRPPGTFAGLGIPLIPKSEWAARIDKQEELSTNLYHFAISNNLPCKDQGNTNYCWINAPAYCADLIRLIQCPWEVPSHSPASVGGPIKGFANRGGWGSEGLEYMREFGMNLTQDWPDNAIDRRYYTEANKQKAMASRVLEYFVLTNWEEVVSCILSLVPVALGYNWWSHEVSGVRLADGGDRLGIRNSWGMGWGDRGHGWLEGNKRMPDDAVAIVSLQPV